MIINHNMSAIFADRQLKLNDLALDKSMEKLSSGSRITRAGDDASGLAVSEKMRSQIRGLRQASTNAANGISFIQTTEGYLQESQDIIQRLRELSVQSANGIYTDEDRMQIQVEVSALVNEVDRIASHAQFNGMNMLTGRFARPAGAERGHRLHVAADRGQHGPAHARVHRHDDRRGAGDPATSAAGRSSPCPPRTGPTGPSGTLDAALKLINKQRADLGAYQNRLEYAVKGLDVGAENLQAAESRIRDADMATEMVEYTKNAILTQAATAMLAQANTKPRTVLQLLQ